MSDCNDDIIDCIGQSLPGLTQPYTDTVESVSESDDGTVDITLLSSVEQRDEQGNLLETALDPDSLIAYVVKEDSRNKVTILDTMEDTSDLFFLYEKINEEDPRFSDFNLYIDPSINLARGTYAIYIYKNEVIFKNSNSSKYKLSEINKKYLTIKTSPAKGKKENAAYLKTAFRAGIGGSAKGINPLLFNI